jgi:hypothetical protein
MCYAERKPQHCMDLLLLPIQYIEHPMEWEETLLVQLQTVFGFKIYATNVNCGPLPWGSKQKPWVKRLRYQSWEL